MCKAIVNKIIRFSSVDGPGNRTAIFLQGCNFDCDYCHNPETINLCSNCGLCISSCKTGAITLKDKKIVFDLNLCVGCDECIKACVYNSSPKVMIKTVDEVINSLIKDLHFIRGITVSGGECTLQRDFLVQLFKKTRNLGLTNFIDTNGSYDFEKDEQLLEVTDSVMLDVKAFDCIEHKNLTKAHNKLVLKNLEFLAKKNKLYEIRTVVYPKLMNDEHTVVNCSNIIANYPNIIYKLIRYRNFGVRDKFKDVQSPTKEYMNDLADIAKKNGVTKIVVT